MVSRDRFAGKVISHCTGGSIMTDKKITSEVFVAYSQCPRKAFLLLFSEDQGTPHDYPRILEERRKAHQTEYLEAFKQTHEDAKPYNEKDLRKGEFFVEATLKAECWEADCDVLTKVDQGASSRKLMFEPTIAIGTYSITKEQRTELLFIGKVLGQIQKQLPAVGAIVGMDGKAHRVKLESGYRAIAPFLKTLQAWIEEKPAEPPALILNKHCPSCQFRDLCREQAVKENNLSLLDRMTAKAVKNYNKKGIFTLHQLSYLFKPRRNRKRKTKAPVKHSLELQALAIREQKIYIQELPELTRKPVELFLDIEGVPDQSFYYLIGLLVCEGENNSYYSFWADTTEDEEKIWRQLIKKLNEYPEAPIYHYGNYELKVFNELEKKYSTDCKAFRNCLENINSYIYGKIYFPTFSNGLKEIASLIGASWTSPVASGLQSLVWRYKWETKKEVLYQKTLITYNIEDCKALKFMKDKLSNIKNESSSHLKISFADQVQKFETEKGKSIHQHFEIIIKSAHADYDKNKISLKQTKLEQDNQSGSGESKRKERQTYRKIIPKPQKEIQLTKGERCPVHQNISLEKSQEISERIIIDLVFLKNGVKKTVIKYWGEKGYCPKCLRHHAPPDIKKFGKQQIYGHGFQVWIVYQRLVLRLPYRTIVQAIEEQFHERINMDTAVHCISYVARIYIDAENSIVKRLLEGSFIHADETRISINGEDWYVWVFTNGTQVIFKLSETREAGIAHEILSDYKGILVSDFYPGYDALNCRQQKCWVHLIRDLNDDLWKDPFDTEFEAFVLEVRNLILPIFETIEKYGLKTRNLNKFMGSVTQFFKNFIENKEYQSEIVIRYQKRFNRYRESLFNFLAYDGIPWHNNTAENAIRHFAIQRTISGSFSKTTTKDYLLLLGIKQTCRFQNKPFLKFLLSGEKNIDSFKAPRRSKNTRPVGTPKKSKSIPGNEESASS